MWYDVNGAMNPNKKIGLILIIIGICIPLLTLPFLSGFSKDKSFKENLYNVGIQIRKEAPANPVTNVQPTEKRKPTYSDVLPRRIQFRFILALAVLLLFIGIVKIEQSRQKPGSGETQN